MVQMKWFRGYLFEAPTIKKLQEHQISIFHYNTNILGGVAAAPDVVWRAETESLQPA